MLTETTPAQDRALMERLAQREAVDITIDTTAILQWIRDTFSPEDVFSYQILEMWAENYGYVES